MRLAKVTGQVVATIRSPSMQSDKLCLVEFVDQDGVPSGDVHVALDQLGAGEGEWVLVVAGSSAREACRPSETRAAVDLCVVAIVDEVSSNRTLSYRKHG